MPKIVDGKDNTKIHVFNKKTERSSVAFISVILKALKPPKEWNRDFYTLQHLPLRVQGGSCTLSVQQQEAPGTGAWGNIRLRHLSGF